MLIIISIFLIIFVVFSFILLFYNIKLQKRIEKHEKKEMELYSKIEALTKVKNRLKRKIEENNSLSISNQKYFGKKVIVGNNLKSGAKITQKFLQKMGFSVEIVQDPQDIIDSINAGEKYDAILTNSLYRYGKTGEELLQTLKSIKGFKTPIIVHTIDKGKEFHYVNEIGFDGYLEKPLDEKSVINVMDRLLTPKNEV